MGDLDLGPAGLLHHFRHGVELHLLLDGSPASLLVYGDLDGPTVHCSGEFAGGKQGLQIGEHSLGLPVVDPEMCTSCGDCVDACPLDLFEIMPLDHRLLVQCKNLLEGDTAEEVCAVACTACARCVQDAAPGLIEIENGLAVVDYERIETANPDAIARCPTGAIVWVEGAQFASIRELAGSEAG